MSKLNMDEYKNRIKVATTVRELNEISMQAFEEDDTPFDYSYVLGKTTATRPCDVILEMCIKRERQINTNQKQREKRMFSAPQSPLNT